MMRFLGLWIAILFFAGVTVQAKELLGHIKINDVFINPTFEIIEPSQGGFDLGSSSFGVLWTLDNHISTQLRVGSLDLLNRPQIYSSEDEDRLGIFEAYAELSGLYGRLRMGLIPLEFGIEGKMQESELDFPRAMFFREKAVGLRDLGLSYRVGYNNYYTHFAVHNGEGEQNVDGFTWMTASWGWDNDKNLHLGISGQTGKTDSKSTNLSASTLADFDPNRQALWRTAAAHLHWHPNVWDFRLELLRGERLQDEKLQKFIAGHTDLMWTFLQKWRLLIRYDFFDPNGAVSKDSQKEVSLGIALKTHNGASTVYLIGTKVMEEGEAINNDRILLIWRLTPNI